MKKLTYIFLSLLLLAGCTGTSRQPQLVAMDSLLLSRPDSALTLLRGMSFTDKADRMYHYLLLADACNKCYDTLPSDTILQEVADFYDHHGTPNEQVRAHYLLGCAYRDMGEAPHALDCYHDAIEHADTTASDCNYWLLSRVHSQTAALLGEQMLPNEQLEELTLQYTNALRANDTLCALKAISQMSNAYNLLGELDSVIIYSNKLALLYRQYGLLQNAAICDGVIASTLIDLNRYQEVKEHLDNYETNTGFFDKDGNIEKGREFYYGMKGMYYTAIDRYDSAKYFFNKELRLSTDQNNKEYAYRGLYQLYKKVGQLDSMAKYAELAYTATDAHFHEKQPEELRHMQALYNYSRHQSIARKKTAEANHNRILMLLFAFALVLTLILGGIVFFYYKNKKEIQFKLMLQHYEHDVEKLEQAKYDLVKIQEAQISHLIKEKEADIKNLQKRLENYGQSFALKERQSLEHDLADTNIFRRLQYLSTHPQEKVTNDEWKELREVMEQKCPNIRTTLYHGIPNMKLYDYDICLLDRLYFAPSEIAILTGYNLSAITMKRIRFLDRIFHVKGKGEQFDVLIRNIK